MSRDSIAQGFKVPSQPTGSHSTVLYCAGKAHFVRFVGGRFSKIVQCAETLAEWPAIGAWWTNMTK